MLDPSALLQLGFYALIVGPIIAGVLAFKASLPTGTYARLYLVFTWLLYGAATAWCLWACFFKPSSGIGNGVFLLIALPLGLVTGIVFSVWRAANRHDSVRSLPPDQRRGEELADIERGLELARESLRSAESRLNSFWVPGKKRAELETQAAAARFTIRQLEEQKAKRQ
ncbi:hypothetical protein ATI61_104234 [Archangium gephyra]|uniref:Uncharacterized protein n=1 Tax=Archangium gephyra TaxID=48 RepID=A0AAC8TBZ1_9BACT|nr:hypothetical protein [Archangium gephyra]AKJ00360.1 Hypothetical protein AA314_01986 [Archangium gephyra]REG32944.1 hypothetical protein ATI61_104234 [Archangium gephyra]